MLKVGVVSLFPEMFAPLSAGGITARALRAGLLELELWNPRDFTADPHRSVDDRPYGGGPGMVLRLEPVRDAIAAAKKRLGADGCVIYLSPQGRLLDQAAVAELASRARIVLLCGRYEGTDERLVASQVDEEWSIGDYVLSGGELAAMVMVDALTRVLPGALGHEESAKQDSFIDGLLDYPHYTRPREIDGMRVPAVLLSGDHEAIRKWRLRQALGRTWLRRPDLLRRIRLDREQLALLSDFVAEHPPR